MAMTGLLMQLVMDGVAAHSKRRVAILKREWGYGLLAVMTGALATAFLTAALYMALSALYSPIIAALLTGLGLCVAALGFVWLAGRAARRAEQQEWLNVDAMSDRLQGNLDDLLGDLEQPVKDYPATALIVASLAGFLTADRLH